MADINIDGVVTWLKNWFYDKTEMTSLLNNKANLNQNEANYNVVTDGSGNITVEPKPIVPTDVSELTDDLNKPFTPKSHSHGNITNEGRVGSTAGNILVTGANGIVGSSSVIPSTKVTDSSAHTNIGTAAGAAQSTINSAINTAIGNLSSIDAIQIVTTLPTASSSTMGKLYIVSENSKVNVYYTKQNESSYSWQKMDTDILDELSIAWNDITGKPSSFTPSSHSHGNLSNDGRVPLLDSPTNMKGVVGTNNIFEIARYTSILTSFIKDSSAYTNIGTSANATQATINAAIDTAIGTKGALTDDVDWTYSSNGFTNGVKLVSKSDNADGRITLHLKS